MAYYRCGGNGIDSLEKLKTDMEHTWHIRLSTTTGDSGSLSGRSFTRTSSEPVIFINCINSGYTGYAIVTKNSTVPACTYSQYGGLTGGNAHTTSSGKTFYVWYMSSMISGSNSPTYNLNGTSEVLFYTPFYNIPTKTFGGSNAKCVAGINDYIERYLALV